jgi:hypothetical protein
VAVVALVRAGRIDEARQQFARATAHKLALPVARKTLVLSLLEMAGAEAEAGALSGAIARQRQAIELTPPGLQESLVAQLKVYQSRLQK